MTYRVQVKRKGELSEEIYRGNNRGYAWKLYFQNKSALKPEDKVTIKEKCHSYLCGWKTIRSYLQYY